MSLNDLEKAILKYLEKQSEDFKWILGNKVYTKEETIKLFKEDEKFRKMVLEQAILLAIDLFEKGD